MAGEVSFVVAPECTTGTRDIVADIAMSNFPELLDAYYSLDSNLRLHARSLYNVLPYFDPLMAIVRAITISAEELEILITSNEMCKSSRCYPYCL
jgi:hypothetical protein